MNPKEIFEFFKGKWQLNRSLPSPKIMDPMMTQDCFIKEINVTGQAYFALNHTNILFYSEILEFQNSKWYQKYQYKYDEPSNKIEKYFSNEAHFYELKIDQNKAYGSHKCIDDQYNSEYLFVNQNEMHIIYKVKGPYKNHEIFSSYKRI